jgi:hypothetical protein
MVFSSNRISHKFRRWDLSDRSQSFGKKRNLAYQPECGKVDLIAARQLLLGRSNSSVAKVRSDIPDSELYTDTAYSLH